ncbi:MAG: NAD(P)-dependent oxidoreductase [Opitutales bacterium]|nr:NAD(P)-dependent oxidoreductase [Opitutales bacterium]
MKVLVTGANGFTGSYLTKLLLSEGYQVRVLVRNNANLDTLEGLDVEYAYADLAKDGAPDGLMDEIEIVYHVAAAFRVENVPEKYFWDVNVEGTRKLIEAAAEAKVKRFVHCSTVGVQGEISNPPAKEEDPYKPGDYYQESKVDGEKLVLEFSQKTGLPVSIVRPVGIYGPGDTRFLKFFKMISRGKFRMIGSGKVLYHLTYVEDLVQGIMLAGIKEKAVGEIFTIGGEGFMTLREFADKVAVLSERKISSIHIPAWPVWFAGWICEMLCKPFGITPPIYRRRVDFFIKDRAFDISKAKKLLDYQPKYSVDEGLKLTFDWYRKEGLL